jgi:hypothetical protein
VGNVWLAVNSGQWTINSEQWPVFIFLNLFLFVVQTKCHKNFAKSEDQYFAKFAMDFAQISFVAKSGIEISSPS